MESKIYSLNKLAWLERHNIEISYQTDEEGKRMGVVEMSPEVTRLLSQFKQDAELHAFLSCFKQVKEKLKNYKNHKGMVLNDREMETD